MGCTTSKSQVVVTVSKQEQTLEIEQVSEDDNNNYAGLEESSSPKQKVQGEKDKKNNTEEDSGEQLPSPENTLTNDESLKKEHVADDGIKESNATRFVEEIGDGVNTDCNKDESILPEAYQKVDQQLPAIAAKVEENVSLTSVSQAIKYPASGDSLVIKEKAPRQREGKNLLFTSVDEFKEVDSHALQAPKDTYNSFEELARYLTDPYTSDLYKVRAIWKWVTCNIEYDTDAFFSNNLTMAADEANALKTGKAVCSGYSSLVTALCSCSGLESKEVHGYAKGYSYQLGDSFKGAKTNHSWVAIKLQESWWLFDFTWGAGYVDYDRKFIWDYNEHYFMTDPEVFVLDHFPKDQEWQLVDKTYSMEDFEKWARFHKHFFIHQLEIISHKDGLIKANNGEVEVVLGFEVPILMISKLEFVSNGTTKHMEKHSFVHIKNQSATIVARLSNAGHYYLKLFAKKLTNDSNKSYDLVAQYEIDCTNPHSNVKPFPKTFHNWMPGYILYEPMDGILPVREMTKFRIAAPDVIEMHVCAAGGKVKWTALQEAHKGVWEGDVVFSDDVQEATVAVKVEGQVSATYSVILKYRVSSGVELNN